MLLVKEHKVAGIISILVAATISLAIIIYALLPRPQNEISLLDHESRAYFLYDGLTLNMDGSPEETFWLRKGLGFPIDNNNAKDGKGRQDWRWFDLALERWQIRDISMELGIFMAPGTDSLTFLVNDKQVTTTATVPGYQVLTFNIPDEYLAPGSNKVTVKINGGDLDALVDYVRWHLGSTSNSAKPETDTRLIDGKQVPVIGSSGPCEMNYYVLAPLNSRLQLTIGHDGDNGVLPGSILRIWYRGYASGGKVLWEGEYPVKGTKKLDLQLGNFQDEIVLLSFYSKPNPKSDDWFYIASPQLVFPAQPPVPEPKPPLVMSKQKPRTIVLICEDAMRQDMTSVYGNKVVKTPNLANIAKSGLVFDNFYAASNWTHPSFCAMFTSLPFTRNGAIGKLGVMVNDVPTLAGILSQNNWDTGFFTSNALTATPQGVPRGFRKIYTLYDLVPNQGKYALEDYTPWLQDYLASVSPQSDAFITVHFMDTHQPIISSIEHQVEYARLYDQILEQMPWIYEKHAQFTAKILQWIIPLYAVETHFDEELPHILETISKYRDPSNTVFILLSDHGEELYDHNAFDHGETVFEEIIHIPLIIWGEGVVAGRCKQFESGMDLMPTILDLANIEPPPGILGVSFASRLGGDDSIQPRAVFAAVARGKGFQKTVVMDPWKLTYNDNMPELFNLASDPKEMNNQYTTSPIMFGYMRGILHEWWMAIFAQGMREDENHLSLPERDIEILKGLGYMQN
jgi:choline-sulfatase